MVVLVTGGAGYIGSHTCVELVENGYEIIVVDNLSNSKEDVVERIRDLTGKDFAFYKTDLLDHISLNQIFSENKVDAVIHFAGLKAVGESVAQPLKYYQNNIVGTLTLLEVMKNHNVNKIVFSSSATVYGMPEEMPISEDFQLGAINPYGRTKQMIEDILRDMYSSDDDWGVAILRYFNPIGAHRSGLLGEDPSGLPNNLMPYITQVAIGKLDELNIYGGNYPTKDGTGVRDYIHVVDLAKGHIKALEKITDQAGVAAYNLGTGKGYSVLEMVKAFEKTSGRKVKYKIVDRRPGDAAISYANPEKAKRELAWQAEKNLEDMCEDSWRWQSKNPTGY